MSGSDDDRSEGRPDEAPPPKPAAGSVFDSPWGVGSKAVFTPPSIASFAPPRTSEGGGAVSGELGELAAKQDGAPVEAAKADEQPAETAKADEQPSGAAEPDEPTVEAAKSDEPSIEAAKSDEQPADAAKSDDQPADAAKSDDQPADAAKSDEQPADAAKSDEPSTNAAKSDEQPTDAAKSDDPPVEDDAPADAAPSEDEPEDPPTDTRHADIDPPRPRPSQPTQPSRPTSPWLIIAVVVGILLAIWYVSNARDSHEAGEGPSKPNHAANESPGDTRESQPQPRPKVVTHTKDDAKPSTTDEPATEPTSDGGEVEPPPEPIVEPPPEQPVVEPPPEQPAVEPPPEQPQPRPSVDNPRDPSLIPAGTPAENAKAFSKLPVAPSDGPPIGGIGRSGIHVDEIAMGEGRDNVGCEQPTRAFTTSGTEFVNVCFRVIHPRASETLRVYWEKDGAVTRRGKVRIPENLHAYKTRAYLQVRPEYVGKWRVRIVPEGEDDTELAVAEFEITN